MSHRPDPENYYAILGVAPTASADEIRVAFRVQAKALHPDKNRQVDTKERFQRLQQAYAVLGRPERRRQYDYRPPEPVVETPIRPPEPKPAPMTEVPPTSAPWPWRRYGLAGLVFPVVVVGVLIYIVNAPEEVHEKQVVRPKAAELHEETEAAIARHAQGILALPAEPTTGEVFGRDGRKVVVPREESRRLVPLYERLLGESRLLQKRKEEMEARKAALESESRKLNTANGAAVVDLRMKADAFNRDGAALRQHFELHVAEVEAYFKQVERLAGTEPRR